MKKAFAVVLIALLAAFALAGCGAPALPAPTPTPEPTPSPTPEPTPEPTVYEHTWPSGTRSLRLAPEETEDLLAQSELLPDLEKIVLIETVDDGALLASLQEAFPEAELSYRVELGGRLVDCAETELDLSTLTHEDVPEACEKLLLLPKVTRIVLSDTAAWEDVGAFQALPTAPTVERPFTLYGRSFNTADVMMDLNKVRIQDNGAALREVLPYMTSCHQVDMEDCGIRNEDMAVLRDDFPSVKIVWRVHFSIYTVRTDETRILASIRDIGMNSDTVACLKYCTEVRYLDLGHNLISNISFVEHMPDLEVAILAINTWADASPLASCTKLEYLEMFNTNCTDLTPLAGLTNLKHLNIAWIHELSDITPLYGMTQLERLWIGSVHNIPREQIEEIQRRLPNTRINVTTENPTLEGWREDPRYDLLVEQMGYNGDHIYST